MASRPSANERERRAVNVSGGFVNVFFLLKKKKTQKKDEIKREEESDEERRVSIAAVASLRAPQRFLQRSHSCSFVRAFELDDERALLIIRSPEVATITPAQTPQPTISKRDPSSPRAVYQESA